MKEKNKKTVFPHFERICERKNVSKMGDAKFQLSLSELSGFPLSACFL
jgi:hypothetical protein